jgi:hypothetical protein
MKRKISVDDHDETPDTRTNKQMASRIAVITISFLESIDSSAKYRVIKLVKNLIISRFTHPPIKIIYRGRSEEILGQH